MNETNQWLQYRFVMVCWDLEKFYNSICLHRLLTSMHPQKAGGAGLLNVGPGQMPNLFAGTGNGYPGPCEVCRGRCGTLLHFADAQRKRVTRSWDLTRPRIVSATRRQRWHRVEGPLKLLPSQHCASSNGIRRARCFGIRWMAHSCSSLRKVRLPTPDICAMSIALRRAAQHVGRVLCGLCRGNTNAHAIFVP